MTRPELTVRMEEVRLHPGSLASYLEHCRTEVLPAVRALPGCVSAELLAAGEGDPRVVLITRWVDVPPAAGHLPGDVPGPARPPHAWDFRALPW